MKTLTSEQLGTFFQEAKETGVYELYYLDLATGLRRGELLGLKWTDEINWFVLVFAVLTAVVYFTLGLAAKKRIK